MSEASKDETRIYNRVLACAQLIFPDMEVTGEHGEGNVIFHVKKKTGEQVSGMSMAFETETLLEQSLSNVELLRQITQAAHRFAVRNMGRIQPYVPSVDPDEAWPDWQLLGLPPGDNRLVVVAWESERGPGKGSIATGKFEDGVWQERDGRPFKPEPRWNNELGKYDGESPLTHWRDLSAYEKATADRQ
jgi:hypothetical protein